MLLDLGYPVANTLEGAAIGDVIDENDPLCPAEVGGGDGAEALLAGGIPDLEFDALVVDFNVFDFEVDSDGCDKGGGEGVVGVSEEEAGFSDARVSYHEEFDLHVIGCSVAHCVVLCWVALLCFDWYSTGICLFSGLESTGCLAYWKGFVF